MSVKSRKYKLTWLGALVALSCLGVLAMNKPVAAQNMTITLKADEVGKAASTKRIIIPLNKSKIIELPVDAVDVLISNPEIADANVRTPRLIYIVGNQIGQTNAFFFDGEGNRILNLEICVEQDIIPLRNILKKFMPESRIQVSVLKDNIILAGTVANAIQADKARALAARFVGDEDKVVNMLIIEGGEQVLLKVRIVEMQRTVAKQLGVDTTAAFSLGQASIGVLTANPFSLAGSPLSSSLHDIDYSTPQGDRIQSFVRALERVGMLRTLAEPTLTSVSGETANFLVGGEFAVPTGRDRNGNITIVFKPFGVGLAFTPVVMSGGLISLKISTEVSELSQEGAFSLGGTTFVDENDNVITVPGLTIPGLKVRRAETTVELPSGGSMVIAGLLQDEFRQNIDGVPGIKDIPIIGALAKSRDFLNNQTELVIMVTPYIVDAVQEKQLVTPDQGFAPPTDAQSILFGQLNVRYGRGQIPGTRTIQGPMGFIVE